ncbi:class I SAM-dependent methyltransferase [Bradyrhizobium sp. LTSP849]|uniref:class I SAM-dependent methyltransferase n=1 Tax=Bradyrhizobium sp. LTSP849 TaxID=1615890 RepID=UPI0009E32A50|nr:class I SAM-dependent methyltransferase [Bradyrhizobium sp. LTSP849]
MENARAASPTPDQVKAYYDAFSTDRMLRYRVDGNLRIEKAIAFFCSSIEPNDSVLDIGCGIGIATEAMASRTQGSVLGVDISDQNIWYATQSVSMPNLRFVSADVLDEAVKLPLDAPPSIITLCDVIEHIPESQRTALFRKLSALGGPSLKVMLTFPTACNLEYQAQEEPSELQIIDNQIPPQTLAQEAALAGLSMTYFRMISVWREVEYAHCIFERNESLKSRVRTATHLPGSLRQKLKGRLVDPFVRRSRRRKYIDGIFGKR